MKIRNIPEKSPLIEYSYEIWYDAGFEESIWCWNRDVIIEAVSATMAFELANQKCLETLGQGDPGIFRPRNLRRI